MKTIKLTLDVKYEESCNYSLDIKVNEYNYNKAVETINKAVKNMPDIRIIQDELNLSDEIDFVLAELDKAKIEYHIPKVDKEIIVIGG